MTSQGDDLLAEALARLAESRRDEAAWELLYNLMWPFVLSIMFRRLGGARDLAEDASQEVFCRLVRYCPFGKLQDPREFRQYLARVAYNAGLDHIRRALGRAEVSLEDGKVRSQVLARPDPIDLEGQVESRDLVGKLFAHLDAKEHRLLRLLIEHRSLPEIARRLSVSYGNAAVRVFRLRRKLRRYIVGLRV